MTACWSVAEMRRHISHFVRTELFAGLELPSSADRRYFPTAVDFRNYIYRSRMAKMHCKVDQVNLKINIEKWQQDHPHDSFHFREYYRDSDNDAATDSYSTHNEDDDVMCATTVSGKGLLFCHQAEWQKHILQRYGSE